MWKTDESVSKEINWYIAAPLAVFVMLITPSWLLRALESGTASEPSIEIWFLGELLLLFFLWAFSGYFLSQYKFGFGMWLIEGIVGAIVIFAIKEGSSGAEYAVIWICVSAIFLGGFASGESSSDITYAIMWICGTAVFLGGFFIEFYSWEDSGEAAYAIIWMGLSAIFLGAFSIGVYCALGGKSILNALKEKVQIGRRI
ncbi:MAG: hypothetical protein ACFFB3_13225 [Candidatus Hodarchaeota archaeon]